MKDTNDTKEEVLNVNYSWNDYYIANVSILKKKIFLIWNLIKLFHDRRHSKVLAKSRWLKFNGMTFLRRPTLLSERYALFKILKQNGVS